MDVSDVLLSHNNPKKELAVHVREVELAVRSILARHSETVRGLAKEWAEFAARFHDIGKASLQFAAYIANPKGYHDPPEWKAHAPLSLFWWLAFALEQELPTETIVAVAAVVWRHHGRFPEYGEDAPDGLDFSLDRYEGIIPRQLVNFPFCGLAEALDLQLPRTADFENMTRAAEDFFDGFSLTDLSLDSAALFRLRTQILFSILVEADRAFLALHGKYLYRYLNASGKQHLPPPESVAEFCAQKPSTPVSKIQTQLRQRIVDRKTTARVVTVTLPTGMGKTLIGAQWLLANYQAAEHPRKLIVVLPFLSVIDQTAREYRDLLGVPPENEILQEAHSLAPRSYRETQDQESTDFSDADAEETQRENRARDFLADTWQAPLIITTFDQFLFSLLSSNGKNLLRTHNLADALIVMDEIQAIPPQLWQPMSKALEVLTEKLGAQVMVMSATQPGFIENGQEAVPDPGAVFVRRKRYRILLKHREPIDLESFVDWCRHELAGAWQGKRIMLVLNTRTSARHVRDAVESCLADTPLHFLTADVIPRERLENIARIKSAEPCVVVATQCIEAGVDIDLDLVVRDFAPLDSIIQGAGRCNRKGVKPRCDVYLVHLKSAGRTCYAELVYDQILLQETATLLSGADHIDEEEVLPLTRAYYEAIRTKKDTGRKLLEDWAWWRAPINVSKALGKGQEKHQFIVVSEDRPVDGQLPIREALEQALDLDDRWERLRRIRELAPRVAALSISLWARPNFFPEEIADPVGVWWLLRDGFYTPGKGFLSERLSGTVGHLIL